MKRNQFTSLIAASLFVLVCSAQKKTTVTPQQLNHKVDLKTAATSKAKIAGIDSLLQSFVDQKKVSSVAAFVAKEGNVVYKKHLAGRMWRPGCPLLLKITI